MSCRVGKYLNFKNFEGKAKPFSADAQVWGGTCREGLDVDRLVQKALEAGQVVQLAEPGVPRRSLGPL